MEPVQARIRDPVRRSIVRINIRLPGNGKSGRKPLDGVFVIGTIIILEPNFMYIVADPVSFRGKDQCTLVIDCLNGTKITYPRPQIHLTEGIAGICCPGIARYDTSLMEAVTLSRSVIAKRQNVHVFSPEYMLLTSGTVMGVSGQNFQHNCSALESTALGSPVLGDNGHLVGICNDFRNDYLEAISAHGIASEIEKAQGREFISIDQTLQHLRIQNTHE